VVPADRHRLFEPLKFEAVTESPLDSRANVLAIGRGSGDVFESLTVTNNVLDGGIGSCTSIQPFNSSSDFSSVQTTVCNAEWLEHESRPARGAAPLLTEDESVLGAP